MDRDTLHWKERALKHAYILQERIHALDHAFYTGCGFHQELVRDIAKTIKQIEALNQDSHWDTLVTAQISLELDTEYTAKAEKSAKEEWNRAATFIQRAP